MKKSLSQKALVLVAFFAAVCMSGISYAEDTSKTHPVIEKAAAPSQLGTVAGKKNECANMPEPKVFALEALSIIGGNYDVNPSTTTTTSPKKGPDGAACSGNDECTSKVCEGGSCCTDYGAPCDTSSHCCGHQSCTKGACPQ